MKNQIIAFQGEHGAFSEQAAHAYYLKSTKTVPYKTFSEVFRAVERTSVRYGIIPIENSLFGSIHQNYDLLQKFNLFIVGEIKLRVVHTLLVNPTVSMKHVRFIYSHPQALGQCERFLSRLKNIEVVAVYDTAGAAKMIKEQTRDRCSSDCKQRSSARVRVENIVFWYRKRSSKFYTIFDSRKAQSQCEAECENLDHFFVEEYSWFVIQSPERLLAAGHQSP